MKKEKIIDFGILVLRWYLIFYMIKYGWSKVTLSQFGVYDASILDQPIKDIGSFYVTWHLFGRSTFFNISTGVLEIIGGILLIFNRTVLIGTLLVLSILAQILIIDIAFTTGVHGFALPIRIGGMILADLLILFYYKDKVIIALQSLTNEVSTKFKYKWWVFLILPVIGFLMDFVFGILTYPIKTFLNWIVN
ncbi:DoxX family membrane protein [Maribacter sp. IgM3_T14_3]|uniref:DoxX family membrane protein n=1 Tax=Maribacter sp. IgM3_T14_3 TaxID=3415140 RepID=UPI003C702F6F